jgi:Lipase (class 3)
LATLNIFQLTCGAALTAQGDRIVPERTDKELQTLFTLAMLPNLGACFAGEIRPDAERKLKAEIEGRLERLSAEDGAFGRWSIPWGPAIDQKLIAHVPDHVMFMAQRGNQFVIAIAGTNFRSGENILEDIDVSEQVPWSDFTLDSRKIAKGTRHALTALQTIVPTGLEGLAEGTLQHKLRAEAAVRPITVHVCGHSLGGALAATLALWLEDTRAGWDPARRASLSVLAVAGPTVGNPEFAAYSNSQIGSRITRLYNPLDVIPLHWNLADLDTIRNLYVPVVEADAAVNFWVLVRKNLSQQGGPYSQIETGQALPRRPPNPDLAPQASNQDKFFAQLGYQHVRAYFELLDLQDRFWIQECPR